MMNEFRIAVNTGRIVHDRDLRRWALKAYNDEGNKNIARHVPVHVLDFLY